MEPAYPPSPPPFVVLYHRTTPREARAILAQGFRDRTDRYGTRQEHTGVWLSDVPLDANEGAFGDALLAVRFAAGDLAELTNYEWLEDGKPYREWLVPAALVNGRATVRVASDP